MFTMAVLLATPVAALAGDSSYVTDREGALGLSRVNHNDGTFHYALPGGASTADQVGDHLTWRYQGQASFRYEYTAWAASTVYDDGVHGTDDATHGRGAILGSERTDKLGRIWQVIEVDAQSLDEAIEDYDDWADSEFGAESLSGGTASAGEADGAGTYTLTPLAFVSQDCDGNSLQDLVRWEDESRTAFTTLTDPRDATVKIYRDQSPGCSGTLIRGKFVLTAAHCVTDGMGTEDSANRFDVCTRGNRLSGATCSPVEEVKKAAGWTGGAPAIGTIKHDWAILVLTDDLGSVAALRGLSKATSGDLSGADVGSPQYPTFLSTGSSSCTSQLNTGTRVDNPSLPTAIGVDQPDALVEGTGKRTVRTRLDASKGGSGAPIYYTSGSTIRIAGVMTYLTTGYHSFTGGPRVADFRDEALGLVEDLD